MYHVYLHTYIYEFATTILSFLNLYILWVCFDYLTCTEILLHVWTLFMRKFGVSTGTGVRLFRNILKTPSRRLTIAYRLTALYDVMHCTQGGNFGYPWRPEFMRASFGFRWVHTWMLNSQRNQTEFELFHSSRHVSAARRTCWCKLVCEL